MQSLCNDEKDGGGSVVEKKGKERTKERCVLFVVVVVGLLIFVGWR
jgi:hypothetical protein